MRRLDSILVSEDVFNMAADCFITPAARTDHNSVTLEILCVTFSHGPSYWKFNNCLLNDKKYVDMINTLIDEELALNNGLEPPIKWDLSKVKIREAVMKFAKQRSHDKKNHLKNKLQV